MANAKHKKVKYIPPKEMSFAKNTNTSFPVTKPAPIILPIMVKAHATLHKNSLLIF
jgi:hypothetical protein